ncbi:hypothetical protein [Methylocystis parvus]|uniref:hypothetical protein n=1 Tax=Methylocystis parvus TaxID=134 RepID=UPI003C766E4D
MLNSSWRLPRPTDVMVLGGVIIAAIASIAAVPAATPNPACSPSVVHFIAEPKPLSAKPMPADWPILERLATPYVAEEAKAEAPQPAVIQEAMNAAPAPEPEEDTPSRRPRGHHRHHRR